MADIVRPPNVPIRWVPRLLPSGGNIWMPPGWNPPRAWAPPPPTARIRVTPIKPPGSSGPGWWARNANIAMILLPMDGHDGDQERRCANLRGDTASALGCIDDYTRMLGNVDYVIRYTWSRARATLDCQHFADAIMANIDSLYWDAYANYLDFKPFADAAQNATCDQLLDLRNGFVQSAAACRQEMERIRGLTKSLIKQFQSVVANCGVPDVTDFNQIRPLPPATANVNMQHAAAAPGAITDPMTDPDPCPGWEPQSYSDISDGLGYVETDMANFMVSWAWSFYRVTVDPNNPWPEAK